MLLAVGATFAVCCGLPVIVGAGIVAGFTGFLLGGVALAVLGVIVAVGLALLFLGKQRNRHGPLRSKRPASSAEEPVAGSPTDTTASRDQQLRSIQLRVSGMDCPACADRVETALRREPGIVEARLGSRQGLAIIVFDESVTSERAILASSAFSGEVKAELLP